MYMLKTTIYFDVYVRFSKAPFGFPKSFSLVFIFPKMQLDAKLCIYRQSPVSVLQCSVNGLLNLLCELRVIYFAKYEVESCPKRQAPPGRRGTRSRAAIRKPPVVQVYQLFQTFSGNQGSAIRILTVILSIGSFLEVLQSSMIVLAFWPVVCVFVLVVLIKYVLLFLVQFSYFIKSYFVVIKHKYVCKNIYSCKNIRSLPNSKSCDPYPHLNGGQTLGTHRLCPLCSLHLSTSTGA